MPAGPFTQHLTTPSPTRGTCSTPAQCGVAADVQVRSRQAPSPGADSAQHPQPWSQAVLVKGTEPATNRTQQRPAPCHPPPPQPTLPHTHYLRLTALSGGSPKRAMAPQATAASNGSIGHLLGRSPSHGAGGNTKPGQKRERRAGTQTRGRTGPCAPSPPASLAPLGPHSGQTQAWIPDQPAPPSPGRQPH